MKVLAEHEITDYKERLDLYDAQERKRLEDSGAIRPQRTGHRIWSCKHSDKNRKIRKGTLTRRDKANIINVKVTCQKSRW